METNDSSSSDTAAPAAALAAPAPLSFDAEALGHLVEEWYREHMHNSIVSANTPIVNHVRAAVDDLKARLGIGKSA